MSTGAIELDYFYNLLNPRQSCHMCIFSEMLRRKPNLGIMDKSENSDKKKDSM